MNLSPTAINNGQKCWGKLTSINSKLENVDLINPTYKIGRVSSSNDIVIQNDKLSRDHCVLTRIEDGSVYLTDTSSRGTILEDEKIGKNNMVELKPGNRFYLLKSSKGLEGSLGYIFSVNETPINPLKREREKERETQEETITPQNDKKPKPPGNPMDEEREDLKCQHCNRILYQALTTLPCQHNFCGSCYSILSGVLAICPLCSTQVKELKRNKKLDEEVRKFLERHLEDERPREEMKLMDESNRYPNGHVFNEEGNNEVLLEAKNTGILQTTNMNNLTGREVRESIPEIFVQKDQSSTKKIEKYFQVISKYIA